MCIVLTFAVLSCVCLYERLIIPIVLFCAAPYLGILSALLFRSCSFGLAISVFACRVLFVLIYSVTVRTIHPRLVLANSVQHFLCVPFLLAFQVQFSNRFLPRSFLSSIFPSVSVSQSLCLSGLPCTIFSVQSKPLGHSFYVFQFSLCHKATKFDFFRSVQASRFPLFYFLFCSCLTVSSVRFCRLVYAFQRYYPSCFPCRHGLTPAPDWHRFSTVANAYGNSWAGRCIVS